MLSKNEIKTYNNLKKWASALRYSVASASWRHFAGAWSVIASPVQQSKVRRAMAWFCTRIALPACRCNMMQSNVKMKACEPLVEILVNMLSLRSRCFQLKTNPLQLLWQFMPYYHFCLSKWHATVRQEEKQLQFSTSNAGKIRSVVVDAWQQSSNTEQFICSASSIPTLGSTNREPSDRGCW